MIAETEHVIVAIVTLVGTVITALIATINMLVGKIVKATQEGHTAELDTITTKVAEVERKLDDHVTWEMRHPATLRKELE